LAGKSAIDHWHLAQSTIGDRGTGDWRLIADWSTVDWGFIGDQAIYWRSGDLLEIGDLVAD
jgi:hypothetical protein